MASLQRKRDGLDVRSSRSAAITAALLVVVGGAALVDPRPSRIGSVVGLSFIVSVCWLPGRRRDLGPRAQKIVATAAVAVALLGLTPAAGPSTSSTSGAWSSATHLLGYPVLAWVLLEMAAIRRQRCRIDSVVTGALGGLSVGMGTWIAVSNAAGPAGAVGDQFLVVMPVALDVFVLLLSLRLFRSSRPVFAWWALNGAFGAMFAADALVLVSVIQSSDMSGAAGACRGLGCVLLGAAFLHPSAATLFDPEIIEPRSFGVGHVSVVVGAALATPATLLVQARTEHILPMAVAVGAGSVSIVLALYLIDLLRDRTQTDHRLNHDRLTGLPNRTLFVDRVERALAHARRNGSPIAVCFIDVDRFKAINDTYGHSAGDVLLQVIAQRLQGCLRTEDTVARVSGDEFAILLPHLASPDAAVTVAERIMSAFAEPITLAENRVAVTASMGVAIGPVDGADPESLLASADAAMYRAKDSGRSTFEFHDSQRSKGAHRRLEVETALLRALERGELIVHYQPIVDLATGRVVSAEALVRWVHPEEGMLLPGHFVPVAEQSDLVVELGEYVLHAACQAARRWRDMGLEEVSVSVNVAARQFRYDLDRIVTAALRMTGLPAERLTLELTESAAVDNIDLVAATLEELRQLGVRAAIDDFGTGYCGLRYLSSLPVDNLKIDKSFIQAMTPANASIVAATVAMAHSLGLTVTAEGVETKEQRNFLRARSCDRYQGYLFARALREDEFAHLAVAVNRSPLEPRDGGPTLEASVRARTTVGQNS